MKKFEVVAYSGVQYAPALCLWRESGQCDVVDWVNDRIRVGYMGDDGVPRVTPRYHRIYTTMAGRNYIRYNGIRYFLDEFLRV